MSLLIRTIETRGEMKDFIYLPQQLHEHHTGWVPPVYSDDFATFQPEKNHAHTYCDSINLLAYDGKRPVGRIAGIINRRCNAHWKTKHARFGYLECADNIGIAGSLLGRIEDWARSAGMDTLVGPMGFTEEDPEGFMIEGFNCEPNLATYCNFEFLPRVLGELGYRKEVDYVVYQIPLATAITDFYQRAYDRLERQKEFSLASFQTRSDIRPYIRPIFSLMNECFGGIYGYSPLEECEMDRLAERYLPAVDPRFIQAAVDAHNTLVGFLIAIPNMAEGLRRARGRLFPFGILKILSARRRATKLDLYLGGVKASHRGRGVDILMGYRLIAAARKAGFVFLDSHHELETNAKVRAEMEIVGGSVYKRYRIFQKNLRQPEHLCGVTICT